ADAESFEEVEAELRSLASDTTRGIARDLCALEAVLSRTLEPGLPTWLVGWEANWVLDEPNDENSIEFLRTVADMLRAVLACARRRPSMDQSLALMHRWSAEIEPQEPFDRVRNLLAGYFAGTESFEDTAAPMRRRAAISTTG